MDMIIAAEMTTLEKFTLGGSTFLLGLVMVFIVLAILIGLVELIRVILSASAKKPAKKLAPGKQNQLEAPKTIVPDVTPVSNDEEIVAAISAAIAMYYDAEYASTGKSVKFRVRSIKEIR